MKLASPLQIKNGISINSKSLSTKSSKQKDNLRDHMTDLELIFTMLGEASTTEIARNLDAQKFDENLDAAVAGGTVAGNARKDLEKKSGKRISTRDNIKEISEAKKR